MANGDDEDSRVYQALALPNEALEKGGLEILRVGLIEDELYISARPVLGQVSQWGEVLAEGPYDTVSKHPAVVEAYVGTGHG